MDRHSILRKHQNYAPNNPLKGPTDIIRQHFMYNPFPKPLTEVIKPISSLLEMRRLDNHRTTVSRTSSHRMFQNRGPATIFPDNLVMKIIEGLKNKRGAIF